MEAKKEIKVEEENKNGNKYASVLHEKILEEASTSSHTALVRNEIILKAIEIENLIWDALCDILDFKKTEEEMKFSKKIKDYNSISEISLRNNLEN